MQSKKTAHCKGRLALFVIISLLLTASLAKISSAAYTSLDFTRPGFSGDDYNETLDSRALLEDVLGITLSAEERLYLTDYGTLSLSYPKNIPTSYISLEAVGTSVSVSARAYTYTLASGESITCIPKRASSLTVASVEFPAEPDGAGDYKLTLSPSDIPEDFSVSVEYSVRLNLPADALNSLLSKAYRDAEYLIYLLELEEYGAALEKYNAYLSEKKLYDERLGEYNKYLAELEKYDTDTAMYAEYLLALDKYNADYLLYLESERQAENLADEIAAYNAYIASLDKVKYRLSLYTQMKTVHTELKRTLYDAIYGTAVDTVLENEALLVKVLGVNEDTVDIAGKSTTVLRGKLKGFFECKTDEERYIYYLTNYKYVAPNLAKLFASLDDLYSNEAVRKTLRDEDRDEKYDILLSQLYFAAHAFADGPVYKMDGVTAYTSDYKIKTALGEKTPAEILGDTAYYNITNTAKPATGDVYPTEVSKPDYTPVPKPEKPAETAKPTPPAPVTAPTAPSVVAEPLQPTPKPNYGVTLVPPLADGSTAAELLAAYNAGKLSERKELYLAHDLTAELEINVVKSLNVDTVTVTFHDSEGNHVGDISLDVGSFAEINYTPEKPETDKASYVFDCWIDESGNPVNLSSVSADTLVYPSFKEILKTCKITWLVDGVPTVTEVPYDCVPEYPGIPVKQGDLSSYYSFAGWDKPLAPVTGDAIYTAVFEKHYTVPQLAFDGAVTLSSDVLTLNASSLSDGTLDISRLVKEVAGKYSLRILFSNAELSLSYSELLSLSKTSAALMSFSSASGACSVSFASIDGTPLSETFNLSVTLGALEISPNTRLYCIKDGEKSYVRYSELGGKISFVLNTGYPITVIDEYNVNVFSQAGITLSADKSIANLAEAVEITYELPAGYELVSLYYVGADGVKTPIDGTRFEMPAFDVSIGADFRRIRYTVSFIVDGVVISSVEYFLGDTVKAPTPPDKYEDEEYSYEFISWSAEITAVTGNACYTALYERTPLPKTDDGGLKISPGVLRLLVTGGLGAAILLLGAIPSAIIFTVFSVKQKNRGISLLKMFKNR